MDRWRLRDADKGGKRENGGGILTDVQANKLQGWGQGEGGVMELETALGCRWMAMIKNTARAVVVIQLPVLRLPRF